MPPVAGLGRGTNNLAVAAAARAGTVAGGTNGGNFLLQRNETSLENFELRFSWRPPSDFTEGNVFFRRLRFSPLKNYGMPPSLGLFPFGVNNGIPDSCLGFMEVTN